MVTSRFTFPGFPITSELSGTDDTVLPDLTAVHQNGTHADHGIVADLTAMDDGSMSYGHMVSDLHRISAAQMHDRIVLNITLFSDDDRISVAPAHRIVPNPAVFSDRHISQHHRTGRYKCCIMDLHKYFLLVLLSTHYKVHTAYNGTFFIQP